MATVIALRPEQLAPAISARLRSIPKTIRRGMYNAASRAKTRLVRRTPKDRGNARAGWRVVPSRSGYIATGMPELGVINDVPYISILEEGARPHHLNREGIIAVAGWFRRKHGLSEKDALSAAYGFSQNLSKTGQAPTYFVRNEMGELQRILSRELRQVIEKHSRTRKPR